MKMKIWQLIIYSGVLVILLGIPPIPCSHAESGNNEPWLNPKTEKEIRAIVKKWRDSIITTLPQAECQQIINHVGSVPIDVPDGTPLIEIVYTENEKDKELEIKPAANRRDMAYALAGAGYSMLSGSFEGYENLQDLAFWCFLEASLLKMLPDHLSNVGFYLCEKESYDDAMDVLSYAYSLDPYDRGVRGNLAHLLAVRGDYKNATKHQQIVSALNPNSKMAKQKLKAYADKAGESVYIPADNDSSVDNNTPTPIEFPPGYVPSKPFPKLASDVMMETGKFGRDVMYKKFNNDLWNPIYNQAEFSGSRKTKHFERMDQSEVDKVKCEEACDQSHHSGSKEVQKCKCDCYVKSRQKQLDSAKQYYQEALSAYTKWEKEVYELLDKSLEKQVNMVNAVVNDIYPIELQYIGDFIQDMHLYNYDTIKEKRMDVDIAWDDVQLAYENLESANASCSHLRLSLMPPVRPEDQYGKAPTILNIKRNKSPYSSLKIWFFFGSMHLKDDGTTSVSLSPSKYPVALKGKYNFKTNEWGGGVGIGFDVAKKLSPGKKFLAKAFTSTEYTFFYDSKTGFQSDFTAALRPKIGFMHDDNPAFSVKIYH